MEVRMITLALLLLSGCGEQEQIIAEPEKEQEITEVNTDVYSESGFKTMLQPINFVGGIDRITGVDILEHSNDRLDLVVYYDETKTGIVTLRSDAELIGQRIHANGDYKEVNLILAKEHGDVRFACIIYDDLSIMEY